MVGGQVGAICDVETGAVRKDFLSDGAISAVSMSVLGSRAASASEVRTAAEEEGPVPDKSAAKSGWGPLDWEGIQRCGRGERVGVGMAAGGRCC
jgi:hypothetical protein